MAKLTWTTNVSTWYEYELTEEELQLYKEDEEEFYNTVDFYDAAEIVREKEIPGSMNLIDDDSDDNDDSDYEDEDDE